MATRFQLRHSPFTRAAAGSVIATELLLLAVLVTYGGLPFESAGAFIGLLATASVTHTWFAFGSRYELTPSALLIVHGPWRHMIALSDVLGARPLRTLDRGPIVQLRLTYDRELRLIPSDRVAFLDVLEARASHLRVNSIEAATRSAAN